MEKRLSPTSIFTTAWNITRSDYWRHFGIILLIIFLYVLLSLIISSLTMGNMILNLQALQEAQQTGNVDELIMQTYSGNLGGIILNMILSLILNVFFTILLLGYALDTVKDRYESIGTLFKRYVNWHNLLNVLMYNLILSFVIIIPFIILMVLMYAVGGLKFGTVSLIILVILLIYIVIRLILTPYYILDKNMDFINAISASWSSMAGNVWPVLGFILLLILAFLGIFLIIIGIGVIFSEMGGGIAALGILLAVVLYIFAIITMELMEIFGIAYSYKEISGSSEIITEE